MNSTVASLVYIFVCNNAVGALPRAIYRQNCCCSEWRLIYG